MLILFSTNLISQNNKLKKERCSFCSGTKVQEITKYCTNCDYWTQSQRDFNYFSVCRNTRRVISGYKKCIWCGGLGYKPENGYLPLAKLTKPKAKVDESKFACIINSNTNGKNLKQTKDNPAAYSFFKGDGSEFIFWDNGDFAYWDGDTQAIGKWKCVGSNNFIANMDWKGTIYYYRSETNQWGFTPNDKKIN